MQRDSIGNTIRVSLLLCLVCSIGVSLAAVGLQSRQARNVRIDKNKNILMATGDEDYDPTTLTRKEIASIFETNVTKHWVELGSGDVIPQSELPNGKNYDPRAASQSASLQVHLPPETAEYLGIKTLAPYYPVYVVHDKEGQIISYVVPIIGKGLWSTMYGFLALAPNVRTIQGINFYEHGETPGLGGEITSAGWRAIWPGKVAFDKKGRPQIEVIKGTVREGAPGAKHKIDGLAGATITSNGVESAVNFWLGEEGLGDFLDQARQRYQSQHAQ